jgi:tetratricopeptide (TPR) repeat protein
MKQFIVLMVLVMTAALALAQTTGQQPTKPQAPAPPSQPSPGAPQPAAPGQQPGAPAQPAPPAGPRRPQAKTQPEFDAFKAAMSLNDAAQLEAAADDFAAKFPDSELRVLLYEQAASMYQSANNAPKLAEVGRKIVAIEPNSALGLVAVATALAASTRKTDLDAAERWTEANKDAQQAIQVLEGDAPLPANVPPENARAYKDLLLSLAYSAMGIIDFNKEDYPAAEKNLRKSVDFSDVAQDPASWLQLAVSLDKQQKYAEAVTVADKCVTLAGQDPIAAQCKKEGDRLRMLTGGKPAGAAAAPAQPAPPPKPQTPPPGQ